MSVTRISAQDNRDLPVAFTVNPGINSRGCKAQDRRDVIAGDPGLLRPIRGIDRLQHQFLFTPVNPRGHDVFGRLGKAFHRLICQIAQHVRIGAREPRLDRITTPRTKGQTFGAEFPLWQVLRREVLQFGNQWRDFVDGVGTPAHRRFSGSSAW